MFEAAVWPGHEERKSEARPERDLGDSLLEDLLRRELALISEPTGISSDWRQRSFLLSEARHCEILGSYQFGLASLLLIHGNAVHWATDEACHVLEVV